MTGATVKQPSGGPLQTIRVLDLTAELGRYAGKVLAELGADVIRTATGERGPELGLAGLPAEHADLGLLDWWHDANCRQTHLDLDDPDDRTRFLSLVAKCDVLLEAEAPGAMAARGLSAADLAAINPALTHVSLTPHGADGPRAGWRSSDLVAQALGGYLSVTGDPDRPVAVWGRQAATVGGFYAAVSALAGVHRARATGRGSWVDLSLNQALISCSEHLMMYWWFPETFAPLGAPIASRQRSLHWIRAFEVVPCARGACMVSPAAGGLLNLIAWLKERGHGKTIPHEPSDEELRTLVPPLMEALKAAALESDATDLFTAGQALHVPFGESYSIAQVANSAQHLHRGFLRTAAPGIQLPGPLARFAATPAPDVRPPERVWVTDVIDQWERWPKRSEWSERSERLQRTAGDHAPVDNSSPPLPLAGVRVLDLTHVLAGPFATRICADLGADIVRVQTEERASGSSSNENPYTVMWGRSKQSIQLHMKHPEALDTLRDLVKTADVVIDNFSAGVMTGWGAGPEQLAAWNPDVISISMSGCGVDGPWKDYVTYAPTIHALCGLTALTGPPGETDCGPGIAFNDHISGLAGATALLAALEDRRRTGRGQHIELSQYEVGSYLVGPAITDYLATGREATSAGNQDPFAVYLVNDVFRGADEDWVAVTLFDHADWASAGELGITGDDPVDACRNWIAARGASEAQDLLQGAGLAAGVVQNAGHFVNDDPQLAHRDWLVEMKSPMLGSQTTERHPALWFDTANPETMDELALQYRPSAYIGEHNFEVYEDLLGWDAERIAVAIGTELIL